MTMAPNLPATRRRKRRRMTARVRIHPEGGAAPVWEGPASVHPSPRQASEVMAAGQSVQVRSYDVGLPVDAVVPTGSTVQVVVVASRGDPRLVGAVLYVKDVPLDDWLTSRKLVCQRST